MEAGNTICCTLGDPPGTPAAATSEASERALVGSNCFFDRDGLNAFPSSSSEPSPDTNGWRDIVGSGPNAVDDCCVEGLDESAASGPSDFCRLVGLLSTSGVSTSGGPAEGGGESSSAP